MAVSFGINTLNNEQQKIIDKHLTFKAEEPSFLKFKKANGSASSLQEPVRMYYSNNGIIYLPFRFSCSFFNKNFNINTDFETIYENKKDKFSGKLLPRQIEPFQEAIRYLQTYRTVTIALYPGFGKTFLGAMLTWCLNLKTCVLVHRENVGKQWMTTYKRYFDLDDKYIWFVGDKLNREAKILVCMAGRTRFYI